MNRISDSHIEADKETMQTGDSPNRKVTGKAVRILDALTDFFGAIAGILIVMIALIVSYNVVMRYFLHSPSLWAIDVTSYILVYAPFLASAWVLREDGHVKIDILVVCLPQKWQERLSVVASFLGIVVCGLLVGYGTYATYNLYSRNVVMMGMVPIYKWILVGSIPLGLLFTLLQFVRLFFRLLDAQRR